MPKLKANIVTIGALTSSDRARMLELMTSYYEGTTADSFFADLAKKNAVILLRDDVRKRIQGFSTLLHIDAGKSRGIFSGDTVIEREYWGQRALGKAFLRYLFTQKIKRPWKPLYWLLTTKGYKTYLLMANNFREHYPRYETPTPAAKKQLMDEFYRRLYPAHYEAATGRIRPLGEACRLKEGVAATSPTLIATNQRVAFFERTNPAWSEGTDLACIARMTFSMPVYYAVKSLWKLHAVQAVARLAGLARARTIAAKGA